MPGARLLEKIQQGFETAHNQFDREFHQRLGELQNYSPMAFAGVGIVGLVRHAFSKLQSRAARSYNSNFGLELPSLFSIAAWLQLP